MSERNPVVAVLPCPFCGRTPRVEMYHSGKTIITCSAEYVGECDAGPAVLARGARRAAEKWNVRFAGLNSLTLVARDAR